MPFGAEAEEGSTRFRLWAPGARQVTLCLEDGSGSRKVAMECEEEGWYRCLDHASAAGSRYRFQIDGGMIVPDPASRFQPDGVHGASVVIAPLAWQWQDGDWTGRSLQEAVFYELHVGTFSAAGTYAGVMAGLD